MLTITTSDPSNTQAKLKRIIEVPRCNGKSQIAKTIANIPADTAPHQLDALYQAMLDDDIDLYNPHLNVLDAYIRHIEQQNTDLKTQINDLQDLLSQSDRVIIALLASLIVVAVIAVTLAV